MGCPQVFNFDIAAFSYGGRRFSFSGSRGIWCRMTCEEFGAELEDWSPWCEPPPGMLDRMESVEAKKLRGHVEADGLPRACNKASGEIPSSVVGIKVGWSQVLC